MSTLPQMIVGVLLASLLLVPAWAAPAQGQTGMRWVNVQEIYAKGKHNAWPDICRWKDKYYMGFPAHAAGHAEPHGVVILSSADGENWETVFDVGPEHWRMSANENWPATALFFLPTEDRLHVVFWSRATGDATIAPEKKEALRKEWLALGGAKESFERWVSCHGEVYRTGTTYSQDGRTWEKPRPMLEPGWRVWRPHTYEGRHYVIGFRSHAEQWAFSPELKTMIPRADSIAPLNPRRGKGMELFQSASLFVSDDALTWKKLSDIANNDDDEPDLNFGPGGRILAVSRNGAAMKHAIAYVSDPPYAKWQTLQLDQTIHQPAVIHHRGRWIVGGRSVDEGTLVPGRFCLDAFDARNFTRLWFLDDKTGALTVGTTLPSWGDCGQPAFVPTDEGDLLVAYYACSERIDENQVVGGGPHPGKYSPCSIYLARVVFD